MWGGGRGGGSNLELASGIDLAFGLQANTVPPAMGLPVRFGKDVSSMPTE